jgi:hypothetical protein
MAETSKNCGVRPWGSKNGVNNLRLPFPFLEFTFIPLMRCSVKDQVRNTPVTKQILNVWNSKDTLLYL